MTPATGSAEGSATDASPGLGNLLDELSWRGMLHDTTPGLPARLASGRPIAGYNGFDPSGPSLHIGSLVPVFGLLHLQRRGGRPVVLVGGATGMVGDPAGTSAERNLLDRETLEVRKYEGNPEHPGSRGRNCAKGPATLNQANDPDRILHPLRRLGKKT